MFTPDVLDSLHRYSPLKATVQIAAVKDSWLKNQVHVILRTEHEGRRTASSVPVEAFRFEHGRDEAVATVKGVIESEIDAHEAYWKSLLWC